MTEEPESIFMLSRSEEPLTDAEILQLQEERREQLRRERIEEWIWRVLIGLFLALFLIMSARFVYGALFAR